MPTDTPVNPDDSNVQLEELEDGDTVTITYQSRDEQRRSFTATVKRTTSFDGGTQLNLDNGATVYGDFYPPIVQTPAGEELRLYTIKQES